LVNFVQIGGKIDVDDRKRLRESLEDEERSSLGLDEAEWKLLI